MRLRIPTICNRDLDFLITRLYYLDLIEMVKFAIRLTKYNARSYRSTLSLRGSRWAALCLCVLALRVMRTPPPPRLRNDENHHAQHGWTFRRLKARIYAGSQMIRVTCLNALSRDPLRSSFNSDFLCSSSRARL